MLVTLCLMTLFFLVTLGMDATHCSTNQKREMLKRICGNYRRKRGFTDHNNLWIPKRHHHLGLYRNVVIGKSTQRKRWRTERILIFFRPPEQFRSSSKRHQRRHFNTTQEELASDVLLYDTEELFAPFHVLRAPEGVSERLLSLVN